MRPAHARRGLVPLAGGGLVSGRRREERQDLFRQRDALVENPVEDLGPQACGPELGDDLAVRRRTFLLEHEDVLHRDDVLLHAHDLADVGHLARAVAKPVQLDDEVDGRPGLLADGSHRQVHAGHQHQGFEAGERISWSVGVQRGHRTIVAGVHGLEHVERLAAAAFADDDSFRAHAQGVDHETLNRDLTLTVDVFGARLHAAHVLLVELKLGRVLDGDDAVLDRDESREDVEERGLPGARPAGDDDVGLGEHSCFQETEARLVAGTESDEVLDLVGVARELPDCEQGPIERQRANDRVDTGAVGEAGIAERRALVDAAADCADDELDDVEQLVLIDELDVCDHDLGHTVVTNQRLDGPKLLVVLIDIDARDPNCHSSASRGDTDADQLYGSGPGLHTLTRATAAPITGPDPAALRAAAQASRVAPVVATSSTIRIDLPERSGPCHSNAPRTLFWRHRRSWPTWGGVARALTRRPGGSSRDIRARSSAVRSSD